MSSKMEITLKSATLPRPRKTSKAEISLAEIKSPETVAFRSEVAAKIDAFQPQKLRTQRSEVAFPVAAVVPHANRSSSLEPDCRPKGVTPKERIIPIQVNQKIQADRDRFGCFRQDSVKRGRGLLIAGRRGQPAVRVLNDAATEATDASEIGLSTIGIAVTSVDRGL